MRVHTADGGPETRLARLDRLIALGTERADMLVVNLAPPDILGISGLLGLDFLRGKRLVIDFEAGTIDLG